MDGLEWARPAALVTLAVPLLLLLLSLRHERPTPMASGTFELWRALAGSAQGAGLRRRVPPERWLIALALTCAALALAGPRREAPAPPRTWRVVVDASPSMFLSHPAGGTRLDAAVDALEHLARSAGVRLRWVRPALGGDEVVDDLPRVWREPPGAPRSAPRWSAYDEPGTVWLTDRVPASLPAEAGLVASGGPAVSGPVGTFGDRWLDWDGAALVEREGAPARRTALTADLPAPVAQVARAWAQARGLAGDRGEVALHVGAVTGSRSTPVVAARDGWSVRGLAGVAPLAEEGAALVTWLAGGSPERPVVTWAPGRVRVALTSLSTPGGDPAAWAVSWSQLFDDALTPAPGVVSLEERTAAGEAHAQGPRRETRDAAPELRVWPLVALLAALASGLAFLALVLGRGRL